MFEQVWGAELGISPTKDSFNSAQLRCAVVATASGKVLGWAIALV